MCHGLSPHLTLDRFRTYLQIASEMGFSSINYDQLYAWMTGTGTLPKHPILFDFDHPMLNIRTDIFPLMQEFGFTGNWFINSGCYDEAFYKTKAAAGENLLASWEQVGQVMGAGWTIGAHTHSHPDLSDLAERDPTGEIIADEMDKNNQLLKKYLGLDAQYFAFTGGASGLTWSASADREAKKRYRLGRLWIVGQPVKVAGQLIPYGEFVGVSGPDEQDGGPPLASRYITKNTPLFKLPSMELEMALIYKPDQFKQYLVKSMASMI